jgi:hypothetical protein
MVIVVGFFLCRSCVSTWHHEKKGGGHSVRVQVVGDATWILPMRVFSACDVGWFLGLVAGVDLELV